MQFERLKSSTFKKILLGNIMIKSLIEFYSSAIIR